MLVDRPEFDPIGVGLLEMMPDELVDLGEFERRSSSQSASRSCNWARASFGSES